MPTHKLPHNALTARQDRTFSFQTRQDNLEWMEATTFDLLVIGGGITGAGIARDAALRGYKTALVEQADFASGTSSKSSKLVHGGVRYLENLEFDLVFEACRERRHLLRNAPHLVRPLPFVFAVHKGDPRPLWQIAIGMWLYDGLAMFRNIEKHQIWGKGRALRQEPIIGPVGLTGATHYYDAFTDDARLTLANIIDAHRAGAVIANHTGVVGLLRIGEQVVGAQVRDQYLMPRAAPRRTETESRACSGGALSKLRTPFTGQVRDQYLTPRAAPRRTETESRACSGGALSKLRTPFIGQVTGSEIEVRARVVVNATGPWTDRLLKMSDADVAQRLRPTKGVHLVVPRDRIRSRAAITLNSPRDGRLMFLIPWGKFSIIGTTDTDYEDDPADVHADAADVAYILEAVHHAFPLAGLTEADVISAYAGLRPLIADEATTGYKVSREHQILNTAPGFFTITGGKLTTYRSMAEQTVDEAVAYLAKEHNLPLRGRCRTAERPLPGGDIPSTSSGRGVDWHTYLVEQITSDDADAETLIHLISTYGTEYSQVLALAHEDARLREPVIPHLPYLWAEIHHAIRHEMALTLDDVLERRTHILSQTRDQGLAVVDQVADLMAAELGWSPEEQATQMDNYRRVVERTHRWRS